VVGSAQSGMQIAEDLSSAGRAVFLSTCKVGRIPRTYRGRDIFDWMFAMGLYDVLRGEADPELLHTRPPQVSGVGIRGKSCSLQSLAEKAQPFWAKPAAPTAKPFTCSLTLPNTCCLPMRFPES
jgi:putative flavoprotein involved in K+ transport